MSRVSKDELLALERREDELAAKLAAAPEPKVYLSPNMAEIYRQRVAALHEALGSRTGNVEAIEAIRELIEKIVLTPSEGRLVVDLHGEAAAILTLSSKSRNRAKKLDDVVEQLVVVAGARFDRDLKCRC